jgi:hypothetical protein
VGVHTQLMSSMYSMSSSFSGSADSEPAPVAGFDDVCPQDEQKRMYDLLCTINYKIQVLDMIGAMYQIISKTCILYTLYDSTTTRYVHSTIPIYKCTQKSEQRRALPRTSADLSPSIAHGAHVPATVRFRQRQRRAKQTAETEKHDRSKL